MVVRHHGAVLPGSAARDGGGHAQADRPGDGDDHARPTRNPDRRAVPVPAAVGSYRRYRPRPLRLIGPSVNQPLEAYQDEIYLSGLGWEKPDRAVHLAALEHLAKHRLAAAAFH